MRKISVYGTMKYMRESGIINEGFKRTYKE